jgi:hypothetical protein
MMAALQNVNHDFNDVTICQTNLNEDYTRNGCEALMVEIAFIGRVVLICPLLRYATGATIISLSVIWQQTALVWEARRHLTFVRGTQPALDSVPKILVLSTHVIRALERRRR